MRRILPPLLLLFALSSCGTNTPLPSLHQGEQKIAGDSAAGVKYEPFLNKGGKKFRIAVVISGDYYAYDDVFHGILTGLATLGWLEGVELGKLKGLPVKESIRQLEQSSPSSFLEFSTEQFFDLDWDERIETAAKLTRFLDPRSSPDAVIVLGTSAAKALLAFREFPPVLADSISDPINSGIIASATDSGKNFLYVRTDPERYVRQVRLFSEVAKFKRLGVIYRDTLDGRSYAAIEDVQKVAKEKGFTVVAETSVLQEDDPGFEVAVAEKQYLDAVARLIPQVDAIYLTIQAGLTAKTIEGVVALLEKNNLPSFAMEGALFVRRGVLFGISDSEGESTGIDNAKKIVAFLQGTRPRDVSMLYEHAPSLAINVEEAKRIGIRLPIQLVTSSDQVFLTVEK